jgi:hypothetical protein
MSRYRCMPSTAFALAVLASLAIVGASLARGGGDEPTAGSSSAQPETFPWIESPRIDDEPKVADPVTVLLRRVEALESRVATLERALRSPISPSPIGQLENPENWRPFEFNGAADTKGLDLVLFPETAVSGRTAGLALQWLERLFPATKLEAI